MIYFSVRVHKNGEVEISDYYGKTGLYYYSKRGILTRADRKTEIEVWNACDEIAEAAMEIDRLIGSDAE